MTKTALTIADLTLSASALADISSANSDLETSAGRGTGDSYGSILHDVGFES